MGAGGFEPPKSLTTDLQSAPFGHSGTPPCIKKSEFNGAGGRTRTPDLLITNQLLYQLSYTSKPKCQNNIQQIATNVKRKIEFFYKNFNFSKKHCIYLPLLTVIGICDTIKLIITVI